jgi:hypothetical protein
MRVLTQVVHSITSVFGCRHDRLSRPFTIQGQSYMVCLECGRKVFYSMDEMRRLSRGELRRMRSAQQTTVAIAPAAADKVAAREHGPGKAA